MTDRRSLIEALQQTPVVDPQRERDFVYQGKASPVSDDAVPVVPSVTTPTTAVRSRAPVSTRIRSDFASALKRASLERQLAGTEPHTLQDILEEAIEPWLKSNGYIT